MRRSISMWTAWLVIGGAMLSATAIAGPVIVTETEDAYTLTNGIVTATVSKRSGDLPSMTYHGIEMLNPQGRHKGAYWSHSASSNDTTAKVTIDPQRNNGEAGEVSVKGISGGRPMGSGPGGSTVCDIEIRFTLLRDLPGLYTYSTFSHPKDYPATSIGEARFLAKLNDNVFDWMTVDAKRSLKAFTAKDWNYGDVMNMKEVRRFTTGIYKGQVEHKYDYSANQFETLAWGWSSTTKHVGIWFVNPTIEYLSGGPTKIELSAHRDATFNPDDKTAPAPPCLLNYWRGSHYGGSNVSIAAGEEWSKTIGPFLIYCNLGESPSAMHQDALARVPEEQAAWPYSFVKHPDYPLKAERATVSGKVALNDPVETGMTRLLVGLTYPDYTTRGWRGNSMTVDWQNDAKHYEFWVRGNDDGTFSIPNVRPGTYTLHAFCANVLGELAKANIVVKAGEAIDLGKVEWRPVRFGKTVWEIGVPDRTSGEFFHGDHANQWGLYFQYPKDFPNDVRYVVGKSDYSKDWNLMQVPRVKEFMARTGEATPWTIVFDLKEMPKGKATLRLAFAGTEARSLDVDVNGQKVTTLTGFPNTSSIHRDSNTSYWQSRDVPFPASLLKQGENTITLTVPAGPAYAGMMYDYLRLELDDTGKPE